MLNAKTKQAAWDILRALARQDGDPNVRSLAQLVEVQNEALDQAYADIARLRAELSGVLTRQEAGKILDLAQQARDTLRTYARSGDNADARVDQAAWEALVEYVYGLSGPAIPLEQRRVTR